MSYWKDLYIREEQYNDLRRDVALRRLMHQPKSQAMKAAPYYSMLAWLGRQMMAWGLQLNSRFGSY